MSKSELYTIVDARRCNIQLVINNLRLFLFIRVLIYTYEGTDVILWLLR